MNHAIPIPQDSGLRRLDGAVLNQYIPGGFGYNASATYQYFFGPSSRLNRQADLNGWIKRFRGDPAFRSGCCERCIVIGAKCKFSTPGSSCDTCRNIGTATSCRLVSHPRANTPELPSDPPAVRSLRGAGVTLLPAPALTLPPAPALTLPPAPALTLPPAPTLTLPPAPALTFPPAPTLTFPPAPTLTFPPAPTPNLTNQGASSSSAAPDGPSNVDKDKGVATAQPAQPPPKPKRTRCVLCEQTNAPGCTANPDRNRGCTRCKHVDQQCLWDTRVLETVPDGMIRPLACDNCVNRTDRRLVDCSWRQPIADYHSPCTQCIASNFSCSHMGITANQLWDRRHTHMHLTQSLPASLFLRGRTHLENTINPAWQWGQDPSGQAGNSQGVELRPPTPPGFRPGAVGHHVPPQSNNAAQPNNGPVPAPHPLSDPDDGPAPAPRVDPNDIGPRPGPVTHIDPRRRYGVRGPLDPSHHLRPFSHRSLACQMCAHKEATAMNCDMDALHRQNGQRIGCLRCNHWGVVCSVKVANNSYMHEPLPPNPQRELFTGPVQRRWIHCTPCRVHDRPCDRKTPCDNCVLYGDVCRNVVGGVQGRFARGVAGDLMPNYYVANGFGAGGVNEPTVVTRKVYNIPADLDQQYLMWVLVQNPDMVVDLGMRDEARTNPEQFDSPASDPDEGPSTPGSSGSSGPNSSGSDRTPPPSGGPGALRMIITEHFQREEALAQSLGDQPTLQRLNDYREAFRVAEELENRGLDFGQPGVYAQLYTDLASGMDAHVSNVVGLLRQALLSGVEIANQAYVEGVARLHGHEGVRGDAIPIQVPPDMDMDRLQLLNPGLQPIRDTVPMEGYSRPFSPGPSQPVFDLDTSLNIRASQTHENTPSYPPGHPDHIDMTKVVADPAHPAPIPDARPQLADIPYDQAYTTPGVYAGVFTCAELKDWQICSNVANRKCESKWHTSTLDPGQINEGVCAECDQASKERLYQVWADSVRALRAYVCHECLPKAADPNTYHHSGFRVFGIDRNAAAAIGADATLTRTGLHDPNDPLPVGPDSMSWGGFMTSQALPVTGCACAQKLLTRKICTPHRTQHVIDMNAAAQRMRDYIVSVHGKMVCPLCRTRAGTDAYAHLGADSATGLTVAWACLACHGFVIAPHAYNSAQIDGPIDGARAMWNIQSAQA